MTRLCTILLIGLFLLLGVPAKLLAADVVQTLFHTTFEESGVPPDWRAERDCRIVPREQYIRIEALQGTPQISRFFNATGGEFRLILELRTGTESNATLFWTSQGTPRRDDAHSAALRLEEDRHWHTYEFVFTVPDILTSMMIRFSAPDGSWDIRSIRLVRRSPPPLSVREAVPILHQNEPQTSENGETIPGLTQEMIRFTVGNNVLVPMRYFIGNQTTERTLIRGGTVDLGVPIRPVGNLAAVVLRLRPHG